MDLVDAVETGGGFLSERLALLVRNTHWYRSSEAVAERKGRSRAELERSGGRQLREVRLDKEANEAFQALKAQHPGLDGGAIVRLALVATARKKG